jgi:hypothetical protein
MGYIDKTGRGDRPAGRARTVHADEMAKGPPRRGAGPSTQVS